MRKKNMLRLLPVILGVFMAAAFLSYWNSPPQVSLAAPDACTPGPHTGVLTASEQWCASDSPHVLSGDVTVPTGFTLTIEPGVTVQGANGVELLVEGALTALGTVAEPITFTSEIDTGPAQWSGIAIHGGSGRLRNVTVRYSGDANSVSAGAFGNGYYRSALIVSNGSLQLEDVILRETVSDSYDHGLLVSDSDVVMTDTQITANGDGGSNDIAMRINGADTELEMSGAIFSGNTANRVLLQPGAMMGHDASLSAQTELEGYEIRDDFTVPAGVTLTIEPGVAVQGANGVELLVEGALTALGTVTEPITFTSATDSGPAQWSGLVFNGGSGNLRNATVRYSGDPNSVSAATFGNGYYRSAIIVSNGSLQLEDVTLRDTVSDSYDHGLLVSESHVVMTDTQITANGDGGTNDIAMRVNGADTELEMSANTFTGNSANRVLLQPGAMMGHDASLAAQTQLEGYEIREDFTIPAGITLTVEPGVSLKVGDTSAELLVEGNLEALGTVTQPITFTSVADSGSAQWPGLVFDGGTGELQYATIRYAGGRDRVTDAGLGNWGRSCISIRDVLAGEVRLENVVVRDCVTSDQDIGIYVENSNLYVADSLFTGIGDGSYYVFPDTALYIAGGDSFATLTGNTFTNNNSNTIVLQAGAMMNHDTSLSPQIGLDGYVLEEDFTVPPNIMLTIEPGVTVMGGESGGRAELRIEGYLDAIGTPTQPITFTSFEDSGPNQWAGLVFDGSTGGGRGSLGYATVRYGGRGNSVLEDASTGYHDGSNITINNVQDGEVRLEHVNVRSEFHFDGWHKYLDHGVYIHNSNVLIDASKIEENCDSTDGGGSEDSGIFVDGDSRVYIQDSLIQSNSAPGILVEGDEAVVRVSDSMIANNIGDGVRNMGAAEVNLNGEGENGNAIHDNQGYGVNQAGTEGQASAAYAWWGDASGPTHADNPDGNGEEVTDRVLYDPWLAEAPAPPVVANQIVQGVGPNSISPGQTVNLGVFINNLLNDTLRGAVVVAHLPDEAEYIMSTGGGQYWPQRHEVVWQLGDVARGVSHQFGIQVHFKWGLAPHLVMEYSVLGAAENWPNAWMALAEYQIYTQVSILSEQPVSDVDLDAILAGDAEFSTLYQNAQADGFVYYGGAQLEQLSNGSNRLVLVMINTDEPGERIDLYRDETGAVGVHTTTTYEAVYTTTGGFRFYFETGEVTSWGEMHSSLSAQVPTLAPCTANGCADFGYNDCLRNCMIDNIRSGQFAGYYSSACATCYASGEQCQKCAHHMYLLRNETIRNSLDICYDRCDENTDNGKCSQSSQECLNSYTIRSTPCIDCEYDTTQIVFGSCASGSRCINGACVPYNDPNVDRDTFEVIIAGDPNEMYGPSTVAANQWITYTIAYENVGEGSAYGVYVESHLPAELNAENLSVVDGGLYLPGSRTLLWDVGTLGPGEAGEVQFQVQVLAGVPTDTVIIASATVHFPSVPETTPTNDVVTIVEDVVGYDQQVETDEGAGVAITLSGYSPTGNPLAYTLTAEPINGSLSGSPPNLTYTPADNFEGMDSLRFIVSDGVNTSRPASVSILVNTAAESVPPKVMATSPSDGDTDVHVYAEALYDNLFAPAIWAIFNEPIDANTLTAESFTVKDSAGRLIAGTLAYDANTNKVLFLLNAPLSAGKIYTVTLTTAVKDTSGNALAAAITWSFRTGSAQVYLPMVQQGE